MFLQRTRKIYRKIFFLFFRHGIILVNLYCGLVSAITGRGYHAVSTGTKKWERISALYPLARSGLRRQCLRQRLWLYPSRPTGYRTCGNQKKRVDCGRNHADAAAPAVAFIYSRAAFCRLAGKMAAAGYTTAAGAVECGFESDAHRYLDVWQLSDSDLLFAGDRRTGCPSAQQHRFSAGYIHSCHFMLPGAVGTNGVCPGIFG